MRSCIQSFKSFIHSSLHSSSIHSFRQFNRRSSHSLMRTFIHFVSFQYISFIHPLTHSSSHSFIESFTRSIHSITHRSIHSCIQSFISFIPSFAHSYIHRFILSCLHSFAHRSSIQSFMQPLMHCIHDKLCNSDKEPESGSGAAESS
jgi:hypothetical protein